MKTKKTINTIYPAFALFAFACFGFSMQAHATCQDACLGSDNTVQGDDALISLTSGAYNTAIGFQALQFNNTGGSNTAIGSAALQSNTTGTYNTANGFFALTNNTTGSDNTATGAAALSVNTTGYCNTATGFQALQFNNSGAFNTANGYNALQNNNGSNNTATGVSALINNTTGSSNTANGVNALFFNKTGAFNTATGKGALYKNNSGQNNTANGYQALNKNTGSSNTADGASALFANTTGTGNTASGYSALSNNMTGSNNIVLGIFAGFNMTTGSNNIVIYDFGVAGESNTIRIGTEGAQTNTYIAGISGVTVAGGVGVIVDSNGHLGTSTSSARYKENIQPMDKASEAILSLEPVSFRYKKELDPKGIPQFGLVAEQVDKVDPDLVARDDQNKPYTVRYDAVNAMLLQEFLKEHRIVQEQGETLAGQQQQIEALTAGLQKASAQLELSKPAPQLAENTQ